MPTSSRSVIRRVGLSLVQSAALLAATAWVLLGCAEGPPIESCSWGRYHARCGDSNDLGTPVVGCDSATGECRWFLDGVVAAGYERSGCPADDVCCVPAGGPLRWWAFERWSPSGTVLDVARGDLAMFTGTRFTEDAPRGIPVTFDYDPDPADPTGCESSVHHVLSHCWIFTGLASNPIERRGASWVMQTGGPSPRVFRTSTLEVLPDSAGAYHARLIGYSWNSVDDPVETSCFPAGGGVSRMSGTLRLTPDALENPSSSHGELRAEFPDQSIVFRF